eukprot:TRINITY_DN14514_c0_g1_i1.p1 TRINITY_DN14514_c0_g1~~TRINITY_DN14514_c0_g1_i1.p1  ORF type:complete len:117 (-),score=31.10 TRINITY_DN14514_c0_g1_i1:27-377(-)
MCLLLKAADISNCARKEDVYMQWAQRLQSEYQKQGALETSAGLPVSPFMGNNITFHTSMAKLQIAFLNAAAAVSYTHLRAHETVLDLVCRLLLEKKKHPISHPPQSSTLYPTTRIQ